MKIKRLSNSEEGLVSIVVTLVIMSLLTLIAIGFTTLANREQRQALDQQLNTQAFYAAESGVNQAIKDGTGNCGGPTTQVGADPSVQITCVIINNQPTTLEYSDVGTEASLVIPIKSTQPIRRLSISWQNKQDSTAFADNCDHRLFNKNEWGDRTGLLTAMLIPADFSGRPDLVAKTHAVMLYPRDEALSCSSGGSTYNINTAGGTVDTKGGFVDGDCETSATPYYCNATFEFVPSTIPITTHYLLRLKAIYSPAVVSIKAENAAGNPIVLINAQTEIDSTGKTTDVLRRIKVRVPSSGNIYANSIFPEFTTETTDSLCKRLLVIPGQAQSVQIGLGDVAALSDPACSPSY